MSILPIKPIPSSLLILCLFVVSQYPSNGILENHTTFIFQHCSTQKLNHDPNGRFTYARSMLLQKLVAQSSRSRFNRTFVIVGYRSVASVSGLFQCRGDLDGHKCNECLKAAQNASKGLCGNSIAARIQFSGCHVQYEAAGFEDFSPVDGLTHKICGEPQAAEAGAEFEKVRSKAFEALEEEVAGEGDHLGFYSIEHEGVHAMAQCEVGISGCDCAKCVVDAIHVVEEECHGSVSGQVFMELCYFSFEFSPHEVHPAGAALPPSEKGGGGTGKSAAKGFGGIGKLVAIAVGVAALLAMAFLCCRCLKKNDEDF